MTGQIENMTGESKSKNMMDSFVKAESSRANVSIGSYYYPTRPWRPCYKLDVDKSTIRQVKNYAQTTTAEDTAAANNWMGTSLNDMRDQIKQQIKDINMLR